MRKSVLPGFMFYIGGGQYCGEALLLFNRLTGPQPNAALKELIDLTIRGMVEDGTHNKSDAYYFRSVHSPELACQNWARNAHNSVLVNSPYFIPLNGLRGGGATYINNKYKLLSDGVNFKKAANSIFILWDHQPITNAFICGVTEAGISLTGIRVAKGAAAERGYLNSVAYNAQVLDAEDNDLLGYVRSGNNITPVKNGVYGTVTLNAALDLLDYEMIESGYNVGGTPTIQFTGEIKFSWYGDYLTESESLKLYNRVRYFNEKLKECYSYGQEKINNGGFDNNTGWVLSTPWTISGGKANYLDNQNNSMYSNLISSIEAEKIYRVRFTLSDGVNLNYFALQNSSGDNIFHVSYYYLNNGVYDFFGKAQLTTSIIKLAGSTSSGGAYNVDNLSIKEVLL